MIAIINLNMGNVASVKNALDFLKIKSVITSDAHTIELSERIILPGVGSFSAASARLDQLQLRGCIRTQATEVKKPILGICLGMQLLADEGDEGGGAPGLGLIRGRVEMIKRPGHVRIPHVGWNDVRPDNSLLYTGIPSGSCFYFVHSFELITSDPEVSVATADYHGVVTASIAKSNIMGTQFHPEKSQQAGLHVLKNFAGLR
jgi:imidazole glycerol-phosphate synthase subunit HisH